MPVLKQQYNTPAMREAIVLDLGDIGAQASRIRAAAETQAQQIISDAQTKAEQIARERAAQGQEQGYNTGLEQGLAEGREQGRAEALAESAEQLRQLTAAWSQIATDWEQQRTELEREARQAVLEFALRATEKVVHRVIQVDERVIVDQAAQALSLVLASTDASVRTNPVDRPILEAAVPDLLNELSTLEHIDLVEDETVTPGGCVVAFGQGRIDATIERQMQRLVDLILPEPPTDLLENNETAHGAEGILVQSEQAAEPARNVSDAPSVDETPPAPVYEITEQGLVEADTLIDPEQIDPAAFDPVEDVSPVDPMPVEPPPADTDQANGETEGGV